MILICSKASKEKCIFPLFFRKKVHFSFENRSKHLEKTHFPLRKSHFLERNEKKNGFKNTSAQSIEQKFLQREQAKFSTEVLSKLLCGPVILGSFCTEKTHMKNASFAEILFQELYANFAKPQHANAECLDPAFLRAERSQVYYSLQTDRGVSSPSQYINGGLHAPLNKYARAFTQTSSSSGVHQTATERGMSQESQTDRTSPPPQPCGAPTHEVLWTEEEQKIMMRLQHLGHIQELCTNPFELRIQFKKFLKAYHPDRRCHGDTTEADRKRMTHFFIESKELFEQLLNR